MKEKGWRKLETQSSSSPSLGGVFTRSRSEIFRHRTRSGRARPDPRRSRAPLVLIHRAKSPPPKDPPTPPRASDEPFGGDDGDDDGSIHISIKDLRARRVFSSPSVSVECSPDHTTKTGAEVVCFPDRMDTMEYVSEKVVIVEQGNGGSLDEMLQKAYDGPGEEWVQSTPPDCDAFPKSGAELEIDSNGCGQVVGHSPGGMNPGSDGCTDEGFCHKEDLRNQSHVRLGLVPCSRLKLFRNPSSFGYRRLLPYLLDLTKSSSSSLEIIPCQSHPTKIETPMAEKTPPSPASPPLAKVDISPKEHEFQSLEASQTEPMKVYQGLLEQLDSDTKNPILEHPKSDLSDPTMLLPNSCSEGAEISPKIIADELEIICKSSYFPPAIFEALSVEELVGGVQGPSNMCRKTEDCKMILPSIDRDIKPPVTTSRFGADGLIGRHALAPGKGILKKHTKGCLGLCMCLDCASFRLHAERAFEFSRKQMQEAEDVAMGLMKELSCLRKLVEKSFVPAVGAAGYCTLQHNQVKGVCKRASRTEELAKKRLRHMTTDLNIHCRIPRPKVTFAESVEERDIPKFETNTSGESSMY